MVDLKHPVLPPLPLPLELFVWVWVYARLASAFTAGLSLASIPHFIITSITKGESCLLQCLYEGQRTTLWVLGLTLVTWLAGQLPLPTVPYCLPSVPHLYPVSRQRKIIKDTKLMIFFLPELWNSLYWSPPSACKSKDYRQKPQGPAKNPKGLYSFLFLFLKHAGTLNTSSKDKDL